MHVHTCSIVTILHEHYNVEAQWPLYLRNGCVQCTLIQTCCLATSNKCMHPYITVVMAKVYSHVGRLIAANIHVCIYNDASCVGTSIIASRCSWNAWVRGYNHHLVYIHLHVCKLELCARQIVCAWYTCNGYIHKSLLATYPGALGKPGYEAAIIAWFDHLVYIYMYIYLCVNWSCVLDKLCT